MTDVLTSAASVAGRHPAGDCDCDGNQLTHSASVEVLVRADADADGICDDVDPCVGELDACGVMQRTGRDLRVWMR